MNGYDFDKTIYNKDSSFEFYFFIIFRHPKLFINFIRFVGMCFLYLFKLKNKKETKENLFSFLKKVDNIEEEVEIFWKNKKLNAWYLAQKQKDDIVISASPRFLLEPFCEKNGIKRLICTEIDKKNGKILGDNCYGDVKLKRFKQLYPNKKMKNFYSDSKSDLCMLEVCQDFIIVDNTFIN